MGLCIITIFFDKGVPSLPDIQNRFYHQTGLELLLITHLNLFRLTSQAGEVMKQLMKDEEPVHLLEQEFLQMPQTRQVDQMMEYRQMKHEYNHIDCVRLYVAGFDELAFRVTHQTIEIEHGLRQHYFPASLAQSLMDLGGKLLVSGEMPEAASPAKWKKLRQWHEYKWYNRPAK